MLFAGVSQMFVVAVRRGKRRNAVNAKFSVVVVFVIILVSSFLFIPGASGQDLETSDLSKLGTIAGTKTITMAVSIMNIDGYTKTNVFTSLIENSEARTNVKNSTATSCDQVELKKPIMLDPPNGQLETISPEFRWNTIDDMNQDEMRFYIEIYEPDAAYSSALVMIPVYINPRTNWIWSSNFKANQEYEWYAYYYCPLNDTTGPLEYGTFTTGDGHNLPSVPTLVSPEDNSFIKSAGAFTGLTFDWNGNQSINYFVEYQPSDLFDTSYWIPISWVDSTSFSGIGLQNGAYKWRVKARNEYGIGDASESRRFVIGNEEDCINPTGLNICLLQKGDILFAYSETSTLYRTIRMVGGTYWFHTAIVVDDNGTIAEATGPNSTEENQVRTIAITDTTAWWPDNDDKLKDWAVIRPKTTDTIKELSANYAKDKAEQENPYILYNLEFWNKDDETKFYCSQLPWKAYEKQGVDLETDRGPISPVVSPDDLYYSVGEDKSTLVQQRLEPRERLVFSLHSPANLLIIDEQGRRTGFDEVNHETITEIAGIYYSGPDAEPEYLAVSTADVSGWRLQVTGTDSGTYTLAVQSVDWNTPVRQTITQTTHPEQQDDFIIVSPNTNGEEIVKQIFSYIFLPVVIK